MDEFQEILQDFLVESFELIEQLDQDLVELESRPDDLVVIAPDWATQGRMYLGDAIPMADFGRFDAARDGKTSPCIDRPIEDLGSRPE